MISDTSDVQSSYTSDVQSSYTSDVQSSYTSKDIADMLGVETATVRKYCLALEKAGHNIERDDKSHRVFYDKDVIVLRQLQTIRERSGLTVEKTAKVVISKHQGASSSVTVPEKTQNDNLLQRNDERYSKLIDKLEKVDDILRENQEMKQMMRDLMAQLEEQKQYVSKRDHELLNVVRQLQEDKRERLEESNKPWWKKLFK